jgi:hypothetical protein
VAGAATNGHPFWGEAVAAARRLLSLVPRLEAHAVPPLGRGIGVGERIPYLQIFPSSPVPCWRCNDRPPRPGASDRCGTPPAGWVPACGFAGLRGGGTRMRRASARAGAVRAAVAGRSGLRSAARCTSPRRCGLQPLPSPCCIRPSAAPAAAIASDAAADPSAALRGGLVTLRRGCAVRRRASALRRLFLRSATPTPPLLRLVLMEGQARVRMSGGELRKCSPANQSQPAPPTPDSARAGPPRGVGELCRYARGRVANVNKTNTDRPAAQTTSAAANCPPPRLDRGPLASLRSFARLAKC